MKPPVKPLRNFAGVNADRSEGYLLIGVRGILLIGVRGILLIGEG